jgi:hypothetical protein
VGRREIRLGVLICQAGRLGRELARAARCWLQPAQPRRRPCASSTLSSPSFIWW